MSTEFREKARTIIKQGEGSISHMYLDTVGKVTIGVGNMLASSAAAGELPFIHSADNQDASEAEIVAEFNLISEQNNGMLAEHYKQFTKLILTGAYIDELLDQRLEGFEKQLQNDFPDFNDYPDPAKIGLIDMVFNLGNWGLVNKFPSFTKAVRAQDWEVCAKECQRRGIAESRNEEVKELFTESGDSAAED